MSIGTAVNPAMRARMDGVRPAEDATVSESVPPQTVTHVFKGEIIFVKYCNARGVMEDAMFFKVGNQMLAPKDTTEWCGRIFPMSDWMRIQVDAKMQSAEVSTDPLPSGDSVDVLAEDGDSDEAAVTT
jgi:hypothetical protein